MQFPKPIQPQGVFMCPGEKRSLRNEYSQKRDAEVTEDK